MAMPESMLKDWELLTEQNQRQARTFIRFLLSQQGREGLDPFMPQTEAQLLERVDRSLRQIEQGEYEDAEVVEAALAAKYGLNI